MARLPTPRPDAIPRRSFFGMLVATGSAFASTILLIPIVRAALFPLRSQDSDASWSDLGSVDNYNDLVSPSIQLMNITRPDGWQLSKASQSVYVVAGPGNRPRVLSSVCPHLGCTVQWRPEQDRFICPCHGGTYTPDGARISGPPARGMDELAIRVRDGHLYVRFQSFRQLIAAREPAE